jgi:transcriptional regulator with XRE-family HTH domain
MAGSHEHPDPAGPSQRVPNVCLQALRNAKAMSLKDVAGAIVAAADPKGKSPGVDPTAVWRWETGRVVPRQRYVNLLCRVFGVSSEEVGYPDQRSNARRE